MLRGQSCHLLQQPPLPRQGITPLMGAHVAGLCALHACLPHRAMTRYCPHGVPPHPSPQAWRSAVKKNGMNIPGLRGGARGQPPHLSEDLLSQQDRGGRARHEELGQKRPQGCEASAGDCPGQVRQIGHCRATGGVSGGPRSLLTHHTCFGARVG